MSQKPPIVFTCPACGHTSSRVVDARGLWREDAAKRVRECLDCAHRFTTTETIDDGKIVRGPTNRRLDEEPNPTMSTDDILIESAAALRGASRG